MLLFQFYIVVLSKEKDKWATNMELFGATLEGFTEEILLKRSLMIAMDNYKQQCHLQYIFPLLTC